MATNDISSPMSLGQEAPGRDALLDAVTRVESLCPNCQENGTTMLLLHKIPHFRDLLISSFSCPHCNYSNRDVQAAGSLAPRGVRVECRVLEPLDLNRQVVKSESCAVRVNEVELEVPPSKEKAELNTIEGLVSSFAENIKGAALYQRQQANDEVADKLEALAAELTELAAGKKPFTIELDDPSGNSYVESIDTKTQISKVPVAEGNAEPPMLSGSRDTHGVAWQSEETLQKIRAGDLHLQVHYYERTKEQLHEMGYYEAQISNEDKNEEVSNSTEETQQPQEGVVDISKEVLQIPVECPHCGFSTTNNVCEVDIPGFRKCLIFAFVCPACGAKNSEIKAGGAYGLAARRWILNVEGNDDLNRDVLKSDTATVEIPCLEFSMEGGTQAGTLTTIEGLLKGLADGLNDSVPFCSGDSASTSSRKRLEDIFQKLRRLQEGDQSVLPFTMVIDDPAEMSFIAMRRTQQESQPGISDKQTCGNAGASTHIDGDAARALSKAALAVTEAQGAASNNEELEKMLKNANPGDILWSSKVDNNLTVEVYKRTVEQDDSLGILDMDTQ